VIASELVTKQQFLNEFRSTGPSSDARRHKSPREAGASCQRLADQRPRIRRHNWMLDGLLDEPSPWFSDILYRLQTLRRRGRDEARLPQRGYRTLIELKDNEAMTFSRTELRLAPSIAIKKRRHGSLSLTRIASLRNGSFLGSTSRTKSRAFRRAYADERYICTQVLFGQLFPGASNSLTSMADRLALDSSERDDRHGALLDADMTADALILMEHQLKHGESGAPRSWTST
jgi:hypothetical protein